VTLEVFAVTIATTLNLMVIGKVVIPATDIVHYTTKNKNQMASANSIVATSWDLQTRKSTMSNSKSKYEPGVAKQMRQGIVEQRSHIKNKHVKRPYKVVCTKWFIWTNFCLGHYATLHDAEKALASYQHKGYPDLKIIGRDVDETKN
jgi:hypothetical protein